MLAFALSSATLAGASSPIAYSGGSAAWHAARFQASGDITVSIAAHGALFGIQYILYDGDGAPFSWSSATSLDNAGYYVQEDGLGIPSLSVLPLSSAGPISMAAAFRYPSMPPAEYTVVFFAAGWPDSWNEQITSSNPINVVTETSGSETFFIVPQNMSYNSLIEASAFHMIQGGHADFDVSGVLLGHASISAKKSTGEFSVHSPTKALACQCDFVALNGADSWQSGRYSVIRDGVDIDASSMPYYFVGADVTPP